MSQKRQINKRKVWQFIIATMLLFVILPMMIYAITQHRDGKIDKVEIVYKNDKHVYISHESILDILSSINGGSIYDTPIKEIDVHQLEAGLNQHPWIKNAEVYINSKQQLIVELLQNQPIARVYYQDKHSVYYDSTGVELPIDYIYPLPIPIFTHVPTLSDTMKKDVDLKASILNLSKVMLEDTIWNAQITQIYVNGYNEFNLSTIMGDFIVKLSTEDDFKTKLHNLEIFFDKGLHKLGWDTYKIIDLRYNDQVVASPALDYVAPPPTDTMVEIPDGVEVIENSSPIVEQKDTASA